MDIVEALARYGIRISNPNGTIRDANEIRNDIVEVMKQSESLSNFGKKGYYIGQQLTAIEDCMNNFRKGDVVTVGDIKGDEILLEGLAYIDRQFVDLYFE